MLAAIGRGRRLTAHPIVWRDATRSLAYYKYVGDGGHCPEGHESTWDKMVKKMKGPPAPGTLILVRHGETEWNQKRLFTGWADVDLSDRGIREIEHAARLLLETGISVDITYTSLLRRAVRSSWIMLNELDQVHTPVLKSWRFNERMYGALEGHSKPGLANMYGEEIVLRWREGVHERPPPMTPDHPYWHGRERKYKSVPAHTLPTTESLEDTIRRTEPMWHSHILPDLRDGRNVLIVAHRNSLRGILKIVDGLSTEDIQQVSVPNGIPLVYKFGQDMRPIPQEDAVKPLSGIWLGKKGLLRSALAQEAELAQHLEGYPYATSGNKYDTQSFYYHSSAYNTSLRSRYSAKEMEVTDIEGVAPDLTTGARFTAAAAVSADAAENNSTNTAASTGSTSTSNRRAAVGTMLDRIVSGSDSHLIRKLIHLDEERKLFNILEDQGRDSVGGPLAAVPLPERCQFEYSKNPDIFIDPIVLHRTPQQYGEYLRTVPPKPRTAMGNGDTELKAAPSNSASESSEAPNSSSLREIEGWRLNQTCYHCELRSPHQTTAAAAVAPFTSGATSVTGSKVPATGPSKVPTAAPQPSHTDPKSITGAVATAFTAAPDPSLSTTRPGGATPAAELLQQPLLVIIRHGKTEHNKLGLFTGWEDAALSPEGRKEARYAGKLLRKYGIRFDVVYTSWLSRAIETGWLVMNELDALYLPIVKTWRLNERMYGALTGLSKKMIRQLYGEAQFKRWRRSYDERPPPISSFSAAYPGNDSRYVKYVQDMPISWFESFIRSLAHGQIELHRALPKAESLKDCMDRTVPFFMNEIKPDSIDKGKSVLIASSENAIRGLLMHLCNIPVDSIHAVEIPTGLPLIYDPRLGKIRLLQEVSYQKPTAKDNHGHEKGTEVHDSATHSHNDAEGYHSNGHCNGHSAGANVLAGQALLQKYNFGEFPSLLFDPDHIDIPLEGIVEPTQK